MNLAILGPQGCGKGTQADCLVKRLGFMHIDMGLALRDEAQKDTELGKKLNEVINVKKELVSDELVRMVLEQALQKVPADQGIILDGAPRRFDQIKEIELILAKFGRTLDKVVLISISPKESVLRISKRFHCTKCSQGLIMGKDFMNVGDKCHFCGGEIEQRKDDTPEGVRKRLEIFEKETKPVIEYYRTQGKLIEINGEKKSEKVCEEVVEKLS